MTLHQLYRDSLGLLTDLYQLTMAQGYWQAGLADREAVFHLTFRHCPFGGQYAVACGLKPALEYVRDFAFTDEDVAYLATLPDNRDKPLFDPRFLDYLRQLRFRGDVHAMPEGTLVFPREPLVRVQAPLLQAQLLETPLLTLINFPTLVATKAARICGEAAGQSVLEFGLRRAQGPDGGVSASRAAYIGGCGATSNVLAGKLFGIPVKGTHAHSWVMAFDDELAAFEAYADAMPNNGIFLVDTYDTLSGLHNAVRVARRLRHRGHEMVGIRLDSGDLGQLSITARHILDEAGFPDAVVVASGDLDEYAIRRLNERGARVDVWGVGTRLATAYEDPALGGIYKLSALRDSAGRWQYKLKLSEQEVKSTDPGILQVRRYRKNGQFWRDVIYDEPSGIRATDGWDAAGPDRRASELPPQDLPHEDLPHEDLLVPYVRAGQFVQAPPLERESQQRCREQLAGLDPAVRRIVEAVAYRVGLNSRLSETRRSLMVAARSAKGRLFFDED